MYFSRYHGEGRGYGLVGELDYDSEKTPVTLDLSRKRKDRNIFKMKKSLDYHYRFSFNCSRKPTGVSPWPSFPGIIVVICDRRPLLDLEI